MSLDAQVAFTGAQMSPVGAERIRLLEAIGREGSISAAARAVGISYKAAWDALDSMNNLFGHALVQTQTGGRRGGGATLTAQGQQVIATFHHLEGELARAFKALNPQLAADGFASTGLLWRFLMRTSARNMLRGTVATVTEGAVNTEVSLKLSENQTITAMITRESARDLGLCPGREIYALIKSSFVVLAPAGECGRTSLRNRIDGVISRREDGSVNTEISLAIGEGKTLTAIITIPSADALGLHAGTAATALIDPAHIILAID